MKQCGKCWKYFRTAGPKKTCPACGSSSIGEVVTFNGYTIPGRSGVIASFLEDVKAHNRACREKFFPDEGGSTE